MLCICFPALCWVAELTLDYLESIVFLHKGMQVAHICPLITVRGTTYGNYAADLNDVTHVWEISLKLSLWALQY